MFNKLMDKLSTLREKYKLVPNYYVQDEHEAADHWFGDYMKERSAREAAEQLVGQKNNELEQLKLEKAALVNTLSKVGASLTTIAFSFGGPELEVNQRTVD